MKSFLFALLVYSVIFVHVMGAPMKDDDDDDDEDNDDDHDHNVNVPPPARNQFQKTSSKWWSLCSYIS